LLSKRKGKMLDDRLVAQLKRRASESGTSVSTLVEQAVG
jgi:hypothetical protein